MEQRIMGEEIEHAKSKKVLDVDGKYCYRLPDDALMREIFNKVIAPQFPLQSNQDRFFLPNGGALQQEGTGQHVEINIPECLTLRDLVSQDKAAGLVAAKFCRDVQSELNTSIVLHKKNSDYLADYQPDELSSANGFTRGCHENYCIEAGLIQKVCDLHALMAKDDYDFGQVDLRLRHLLLFFTTRQILTGAGGFKITSKSTGDARYFICPRAVSIGRNIGTATTTIGARGIIDKTKSRESLCDDRFGRLHIICGDANMSEVSNFLKFGTTCAVLEMIENGAWDQTLIGENPDMKATLFKRVSADLSCCDVPIRLIDGRVFNALGIQRLFWSRWHDYVAAGGFSGEKSELDERWREAIDCLERDDQKIYRLLDWKIKWHLIKSYCDRRSLPVNHDRALLLDLEYHNVDPRRGSIT